MNIKSIIKAVAIITIFSVVTRAIGFLFRIYLSWELGAELLGVYQVATSILGVLMTIIGSGLPLALSKRTAIYEVEKQQKRIWGATTATLVISLVVALSLCGIVYFGQGAFNHIFADERCLVILLMLLPSVVFSVLHTTLRGTMWGQKKFFWVGFTEFLEQVIRVGAFFALAFLFLPNFDGATNAALSMTIGCLISSIIVAVCYFALGGKLGKGKDEYKAILKSAVPITGVRVAGSAMAPLIAVIVPLQLLASGLSSETAMSEFGVATGMTLPLLFMPSAIIGSLATVLLPELTSNLQKKEYNLASKQVESAFIFSIFISMLVVPLYMGMSEDIGLFIYNNVRAGELLFWASWGMIPLSIANMSSTILNAMGMEGKSFKNYIAGGAVLLLSCLFLTKFIGVYSLIIGAGGCMLLSSILNVKMIKKNIKLKNCISKNCIVMGLISIPTMLLTKWSFGIVDLYLPKFFALAFGSVIGAVAFIVLCLVFRVFDISNLIVRLKESKKKKTKKQSSLSAS